MKCEVEGCDRPAVMREDKTPCFDKPRCWDHWGPKLAEAEGHPIARDQLIKKQEDEE